MEGPTEQPKKAEDRLIHIKVELGVIEMLRFGAAMMLFEIGEALMPKRMKEGAKQAKIDAFSSNESGPSR